MAQTLQQRMIAYEDSYSSKIINRIPIIIKIDGRSFTRVTKNVQKPFCEKTMAILNGTMLALVKQIDGAMFGYQYSDKIFIVLRNDRKDDEDPWFGNQIQEMCSSAASIATGKFINQIQEIDQPPKFEGDITFKTNVFGISNITEVINYLIYKQYCCMQYSINEVVYSIIGKNNQEMLNGTDIEDRKKIIDNAGISLDNFPMSFLHGSSVYIAPKLVTTAHGEATHHKWYLDFNVPLFVDKKERERLRTILTTGSDIFRPERDL
jgi:tRNA(His) 5'-end guanylyltransferase